MYVCIVDVHSVLMKVFIKPLYSVNERHQGYKLVFFFFIKMFLKI